MSFHVCKERAWDFQGGMVSGALDDNLKMGVLAGIIFPVLLLVGIVLCKKQRQWSQGLGAPECREMSKLFSWHIFFERYQGMTWLQA